MYPYGDFPANLAAFCDVLRRQHGFRIGPGEIRDAARVLDVVDVRDERAVRHALRSVLSTSSDTAADFDEAFDAFFLPGPQGVPQHGIPALAAHGAPVQGTPAGRRYPAGGETDGLDVEAGTDSARPTLVEDDESTDEGEGAVRLARARYSPLAVAGHDMVRLRPVSAAWRDAAQALVRRLALGLSRRWRPGRRGRRFDLRRTWRASLQLGGEAVVARWLTRIRHAPRFVVLIDGSRSMAPADLAALDLAIAIASVTVRIDVFTFSTSLRPLTREIRMAAAGRTVDVDLAHEAWGGGTNIGASLHAFLQQYGDRVLSRDTLVIIVSDGLDVGATDVLRDAMRELQGRAAGVTWLNPLLDSPGYEPTSRGMAAARPFVTTFASASTAEGLERLARVVRVRW
jgi:uncharacterized protein with von Willebrand factor type A (vWA) domain